MQCQRGEAPRRVLVTDQALVALHLARQHAGAGGRTTGSADILVGLGSEPEGCAGQLLRRRGTALASLAARSTAPPPGLASLDEVVAAAADRAAPRPPGTTDLLVAVLTVGGPDLEDLLEACGFEAADVWPGAAADAASAAVQGDETVTLRGPGTPPLAPAAELALGRARAVAGGAVDLLLALAAVGGEEVTALLGAVDPEELAAERARLDADRSAPSGGPPQHDAHRSGSPPEAGGGIGAAHGSAVHGSAAHGSAAVGEAWDTGLTAVLRAAALLAGGTAVGVADLVSATLVAGGTGPLALLEASRRSGTRGGAT